jgi:hypothetical protein
MVKRYDAGLLSDYGGGNVEWWQDYLCAEIERCNDHWESDYTNLAEENRRLMEALEEMIDHPNQDTHCIYTGYGNCPLLKMAQKARG